MEATETTVLTSDEFLGKVREKYPQYKDVPDEKLYGAMMTKYPAYKKTVAPMAAPSPVQQQPSMLSRATQAVKSMAAPVMQKVEAVGQAHIDFVQKSMSKASEHLGRSVNPTLPDTQRQVEKRLAQIEQDKAKEALSSILPKATPEQQMARGQAQASTLAIAGPNPQDAKPAPMGPELSNAPAQSLIALARAKNPGVSDADLALEAQQGRFSTMERFGNRIGEQIVPGGLFKPQMDAPRNLKEKIADTVGGAAGAIAKYGTAGKLTGPLVGRFAGDKLARAAAANAISFAAGDQYSAPVDASPNERLKIAGESAAMSVPFTVAGMVPGRVGQIASQATLGAAMPGDAEQRALNALTFAGLGAVSGKDAPAKKIAKETPKPTVLKSLTDLPQVQTEPAIASAEPVVAKSATPPIEPTLAEPAATTTPMANDTAGGVRQVLDAKPLERQRGITTTTGAVGTQGQFVPIRAGRVSSPEAQAAQQVFDKQRADLHAKHRGSLSKMRDWFGSRFVAADSPIRRRLLADNGERAVMMRDASLGASAESLRQYGKVEKEIYKTVPAHLEDAFADYIQAMRTVEVKKLRQAQGDDIARPGGLGDVENQKWVDEFAANHPREFASVRAAADKYWATMRGQLDALKAEGLLTDEQYASLVANHKHYSPSKFIQHLDPEVQQGVGGNKITVRDSGIKSLDAGSEQSLVNNPRYLMGQVLASTQTRIFKNRANRALFDYVANDPQNGIGFRVAKASETPKAGEGEISLFVNGEQQRMIGPAELADSWIVRDPQINSDLAKWLRVVSGSSLVKSVATGYNPEFAIANLPRDAAHAWFATREYSSLLPRAAVQQATDYLTTAKDAFTRKGRAEHYIKEGGGMDFLVHQGALVDRGPLSHGSAISESIKQVQNVIGYLGETSELWGRLAVRERAMKNGKTPQEATIIARNYVDFGQGGTWVKAMDNVVPYLNAGVQGTRGVFRAFKESPATATFKVAQIMATAAGLTYWNRQANKEAWESISDSEKATKWIVTLPTYITDKDGNKRWQYIAIPKDQGQQVFAAVAEQLMEKEVTGKANPEAISMAVKNMLPADVQSFMPPSVEAVLTYTQNHDFWRNRDVWQGRDVSPKEEYTTETSPAYVAAGQATGLSPERLNAAVNVVVPPSNPIVFAANSIAREMLPMDDAKVNASLAQKLAEMPGSRRILRMTYPQRELEPEEKKKAAMLKVDDANAPRQVRTDLRKAEIGQNDTRQQNDRKLDTLMNELRYGNKTKREVREWMQSVAKTDPREAQRLLERAKSKYGDQLRAAKD